MSSEPTDIEGRLRWQAHACAVLGSPLYADLLQRAADDYRAGGPVAEVLAGRDSLPSGSALALRLMGAAHRLALAGQAPELARFYPSCGGTPDAEAAWGALRDLIARRASELPALLDRTVQTNEVGRSAALVGGFLVVTRETRAPLRILELGASAGLNLRWDHYFYEARGSVWGDPASPVRLCSFSTPPSPPFDVRAHVVERRGCDEAPVDPATDEGRLTLMSYVWPDQTHRIRLLRAALKVAARVPATVDRDDAVHWIRREVNKRRSGVATVVFHSVFWQYLSEDQRMELRAVIEDEGASATASAPVAWLSMEPGGDTFEVRLRLWPGRRDRVLAHTGPHGAPVRWLG